MQSAVRHTGLHALEHCLEARNLSYKRIRMKIPEMLLLATALLPATRPHADILYEAGSIMLKVA